MGANMQRQAVPLVRPEVPFVGTGMERRTAVDSGHVKTAEGDGEVIESNGQRIVIRYDDVEMGNVTYPLTKFTRSNQGTCLNHRPLVYRGERVTKDQPIADSSSTQGGDLALGQIVERHFGAHLGEVHREARVIHLPR